MATNATAFGSITIVDITDIGEFSVYPMSNMPLSVVYDPNQSTFNPDWGTNNAVLTPKVYYAGKSLGLSTSGLSVSWKRQEGIGSITDLTDGEVVSEGILTISKNKFTSSSSMITYIVTASYIEPTSGTVLTAEGQITFSLVKMASNVKSAYISGESVFKYDSTRTLVGSSSITLTANISNTSISSWQYKKSDGTWATYPSSTTSSSLIVNATDDVFSNETAQIKVVCTDSNIYDIHTIVKLYDGVAGDSTVLEVLSNDDQMIPCDGKGNPISGAFDQAFTTVYVYEGGTDKTSEWSIECVPTNITGTWTASTRTYQVTGISATTGYVDFNCTKTGYNPLTKRFNLVKIQTGEDGKSPVIYSLKPSTVAVVKSESGVLSPSTLDLNSYQTVGNTESSYAGRFKIYSATGTVYYTSTTDESSYTFDLSQVANLSSFTVALYEAGAVTTVLDTQTIIIASDGKTGQQGEQGIEGKGAINVVLGNYSDTLSVTTSYKLRSNTVITIPFAAYQGITKIPCTAVCSTPFYDSHFTPIIKNATATQDGSITYNLTPEYAIGSESAKNGQSTITFTCTASDETTSTVVDYYNWALTVEAIDGENSVLFQLFTPNGYVFDNGTGELTIQASLMEGASYVTSGVTYAWAKFDVSTGTYITISGETDSTITISGDTVDGYASYRCIATYNDSTYTQYSSLIDKSDPLQATIFSSVGTQIKNGNAKGAIYCKVIRDGVEIDKLKSEQFLTSAPTSATTGDYYYQLSGEGVGGTVTLKKYNGTSWVDASSSELPKATYTWTYRDSTGGVITTGTPATTGKVVYIDGDLINTKLIIDCKVEADGTIN